MMTHDRRYSYGHGYGHGYGGHYAYDPVPLECRIYTTRWRDHIIDAERGEIELIIDQLGHEDSPGPMVALEFDLETPQIILHGCGARIELRWTD